MVLINRLLFSCKSNPIKEFWCTGREDRRLLPVLLCKQCVRNCTTSNGLVKAFQIPSRPLFRCYKRENSSQVNSVLKTNISRVKIDKLKVSKISQKELRRLINIAKPEKWKLCGAVVLLFVSSSVMMAVPFALGRVIDLIYTEDSEQMKKNLNKLCAALLGVFLIGGLCNFGRVYLMGVSGQKITKAIREKVFGSVIRQEVAFFDQNRTGELINRLSTDTSVVSQCVTMNISDGLRSIVMVSTGVSMMFYMSLELALVGLAIVPPVAGMAMVYGRYIRKITKNVQDSLADATQVAEERISNIRTVKAFSQEDREMVTYKEKMQHVLDLATKESLARGVFYGMTGLSGNVVILSVLYYGGVMVSDADISVGSLSSFLLYAAYVGVSLGGLSSFYSELNRGLGASTRLWEIIDRVPAISYRGGLTPRDLPNGDLKFDRVYFSYPCRSDCTILEDLQLTIPQGKITAVVGASGSGKSTLASLLLRLYEPQRGCVTLDSVPISTYDPVWLRSHIGFVSQEPVLFSGTIRDNIVYGVDCVSDKQVEEAAREANAYTFITRDLSEGFDTKVGERGIMLSGGQKQRVAIARALVKDPKILLLDEATSALDAESEHLVQEALERIMRGRTVLTIAHRLSTIKHADHIAVLAEGKVVEIGSYEELMALSEGAFRKLVKHQTFQ